MCSGSTVLTAHHACVVIQPIERATGAPIRGLDSARFLSAAQGGAIRSVPVQADQLQQAGHPTGRLLRGGLNRTLIVRQNRIAASGKTAGRPGAPSGSAGQITPCPARAAATHAREARQSSWTSSLCESRRGTTCSLNLSNRMDSRRKISIFRGLQKTPCLRDRIQRCCMPAEPGAHEASGSKCPCAFIDPAVGLGA